MLIRAVTVLACVAIGIVLRANGLGPIQLAIFGALALLTVLLPASAAPALLIGYAVVVMTFADGHPLRLGVLVLIPLLHLVHVTSALAAVVPYRARIEPAALRAPARRFVLVQVITGGLAGAAALVSSETTPAPLELLALAAVAVVLALVALRI